MTKIINELQWRGLINQHTDLEALEKALATGPITMYCGFDPTGPSLHAGHLVPLLMLARFQRAGHRPIVLAGGATGMIGDPREVGERSMNDGDTVAEWAERISSQLQRFVSFEGEYAAQLVNNNEWTQNLGVIEFLRDIGKHFSLNTMLARETIKRRLENDGISFTEFSYMLLQANDFLQLHKRYGVTMQVGGGDQWGNLVAGVDLLRRTKGVTAHAMTVPLVTDSEGKKFGKSTGGGSLWLDPQMTSPYTWYQYFINASDADVIRYLRWFTFLSQDDIADLEEEVTERAYKREAQRTLAQEMTTLVHGESATRAVEVAAQALFGRADLRELDSATLAGALSETSVAEVLPGEGRGIVDLLLKAGLVESRGAARRALKDGGVYVNNNRISSEEWEPHSEDLLHGEWLVLRRGKKNFAGARIRR
ncbi:tyrosine--tRNA ligase [Corynebacterium poyangense]|uniref:Tyrosine--tRNA ligase n=1 Tax=Corynebacterium poyangense TaxID=2684405 RepID=A0A7H0SNP2_9CORY|nr:tyrosine--tRNA ligase [Corynebacterium poyangense]QNQ90167.1 tyrosine--tRNA ligase [Corynebacterium poyangense]